MVRFVLLTNFLDALFDHKSIQNYSKPLVTSSKLCKKLTKISSKPPYSTTTQEL